MDEKLSRSINLSFVIKKGEDQIKQHNSSLSFFLRKHFCFRGVNNTEGRIGRARSQISKGRALSVSPNRTLSLPKETVTAFVKYIKEQNSSYQLSSRFIFMKLLIRGRVFKIKKGLAWFSRSF